MADVETRVFLLKHLTFRQLRAIEPELRASVIHRPDFHGSVYSQRPNIIVITDLRDNMSAFREKVQALDGTP